MSETGQTGFRTLESRELFKGGVIRLYQEKVAFPDGSVHTREVVRHPGAVGIVPVTAGGDVILIRQHRQPIDKNILEIPAGLRDPGESWEQCAARELREETGATSSRIEPLLIFHTTPGYSDEEFHLFVAWDALEGESEPDVDEILEEQRLPLADAISMVEAGEIEDGKTALGLLFVAMRLRGAAGGSP